MAKISDLKLRYRIFMNAYRYRRHDWFPGAALAKPLQQCRIAAITTAAFYLPDQPPFDESIKGGDSDYREIPFDVDPAVLRIGHRSDAFDHAGIESDPNLALPLQRLTELSNQGAIGPPNQRHFSFMGSITAPGRLVAHAAPEAAAKLRDDGVDAVFLTPV